VTRPKRTCNAQSLQQNADEDGLKPTLELYGEWQLEPLQLPHAVDGIVPKVLLAHFSISPFGTFTPCFLVFCTDQC
jgi:hypothetical protein